MKIENGINPNCSELIIRLSGYTRKEILDKLEEIELYEAVTIWNNELDKEIQEHLKDWDSDNKITPMNITLTKDIPSDLLKALINLDNLSLTKLTREKFIKTIKSAGYYEFGYAFELVDKKDLPDLIHYANISLGFLPNDNDEYVITGHQHCQVQIFPYLNKISKLFNSPIEPFDGGSIDCYEAWKEAGCPNPEEFDNE